MSDTSHSFHRKLRIRNALYRLTNGRVGLYSTAERYSSAPTAKILRYYQYDSSRKTTCESCGWEGLASDGDTEHFDELFDIRCPECDAMLFIVSYPTFGETEEVAQRGHPHARKDLAEIHRLK